MLDEIDYFALERKDHAEGSFNAKVKNLVVAIRYVRGGIPATEIKEHMPAVYALEKKLHHWDDSIGQPRREYVKEIWELLENEPEPDKTKTYQVFELSVNENNQAFLIPTYESFTQHIIAEEWIRESGEVATKYIILEVIEPFST